MNRLHLHADYDCDSTIVSNIFIDRFMPYANGEFVKIYLYLLRCMTDRSANISISGLADFFNQTETDVCRALKYWDKQGVIRLTADNSGSQITGITFIDLSQLSDSGANVISYNSHHSQPDYDNAPMDLTIETPRKPSVDTRISYTPKQVSALKESSDDFSMMLYGVNTLLGGTLSTSEMSTLAYLYDTLHFSSELIEYLIEYCVTNGHKSFRYIEKVALAWSEKGITTVREAKCANLNYNDAIYNVLEAFGITNRSAAKIELDYITKWNEMFHNTSIIIEACNRTMKATHQPSFEYADTILTRWKEANVKDSDDIKKIDENYEKSQADKKRSTTNANKNINSKNRFNNFHQRDIDMDSLEKALLQNN